MQQRNSLTPTLACMRQRLLIKESFVLSLHDFQEGFLTFLHRTCLCVHDALIFNIFYDFKYIGLGRYFLLWYTVNVSNTIFNFLCFIMIFIRVWDRASLYGVYAGSCICVILIGMSPYFSVAFLELQSYI
jgi:hypothetical protein